MVRFIQGLPDSFEPGHLVVTVDGTGIGLSILVPYDELPEDLLPGTMRIYTELCVREDSLTLYGFLTEPELKMFQMLITVNGIGPKSALTILKEMSVQEIADAVFENNIDALSSVKGVGKKAASRIVIDLQNKISAPTDSDGSKSNNSAVNILKKDAGLALSSLGYSKAEINTAIQKIDVDKDMDVSGVIRLALAKIH